VSSCLYLGGDSSHCNLFPVGTSFGVVTDWGSGLGVNECIRNKEGSRCQYKAGNGKYIHATQEHDLPWWWPFKVTCVFIRTNVCHQCSWIYIHVCTLMYNMYTAAIPWWYVTTVAQGYRISITALPCRSIDPPSPITYTSVCFFFSITARCFLTTN
jgi:hypothetical protein